MSLVLPTNFSSVGFYGDFDQITSIRSNLKHSQVTSQHSKLCRHQLPNWEQTTQLGTPTFPMHRQCNATIPQAEVHEALTNNRMDQTINDIRTLSILFINMHEVDPEVTHFP